MGKLQPPVTARGAAAALGDRRRQLHARAMGTKGLVLSLGPFLTVLLGQHWEAPTLGAAAHRVVSMV